jgi:hypothetical protein
VTRGNDGVSMEPGKPYEQYSVAAHAMPTDGLRSQGEASLVITNKRLVIRTGSGKTAAIKFGQSKIHLYVDGVRLEKTVGNTVMRYKSQSEEIAEIVAELLTALMK